MRRVFRENGLTIVLASLFLIFCAGHSVAGHRDHNSEEARAENWESEFLRGSPESKPVDAPHHQTAE